MSALSSSMRPEYVDPVAAYAHRKVTYDFELSCPERERLHAALAAVTAHPYADYWAFWRAIGDVAQSDAVPPTLIDFVTRFRVADPAERAFAFGRNCPIDRDLPVFDWENPVEDKHAKKRTFIVEAFLTLMARLLDIPAVAHRTVNNGDFFHDIAPKKSMADSQSQKTIKTLYFHKDFTNHFARPDYVLQVVLRNDPVNAVYSTYVSNREALAALPEHVRAALRRVEFYTPFDDISVRENAKRLGDAKIHAILEGDEELRVFENRTEGRTPEAKAALAALLAAMHDRKVANVPAPGDFVIIRNNYSLHGKEVVAVSDPDALRNRWIMKTHNVDDIGAFESFFEPDAYGVIDG